MDMNRPGNLYASMLSPIAGIPVKGAIWHQGYNESAQPNGHKLYARVFPEMIKAWRAAFNDPTMPFGIITQETQGEPQTLDNFLPHMVDEGNYVREVHYQTFLNLRKAGDKNIGYASCFDQHRAWYHPQIKIPVGERIASWALATQYGKNDPLASATAQGSQSRRWQAHPAARHMGRPVQRRSDSRVRHCRQGRAFPAGQGGMARQECRQRAARTGSAPWSCSPAHWCRSRSISAMPGPGTRWRTSSPPTTRACPSTRSAMTHGRSPTCMKFTPARKPRHPDVLDGGENRELIQALQAEDLKRRIEEAKALLKANNQ